MNKNYSFINLLRNLLIFPTLLLSILYFSTSEIQAYNYWRHLPSPDAENINILSVDDQDILFAGLWGKGLYRSEDDGQTFQLVNDGLTNYYIKAIEYDSSGNMLLGTLGGGVFKSTTNGLSWEAINSGLTDLKVKALTIDENGNYFAGTMGKGVFKSTDEGETWFQAIVGMRFFDINALTALRDTILAGTNGEGVYRSTNNGDRWHPSNGGLESMTINSFMINRVDEIFISTSEGNVCFSVNGGASWKVYDEQSAYYDTKTGDTIFVSLNVISMIFNDKDELIVGTADVGLWRHDKVDEAWVKTEDFIHNCVLDFAINSDGKLFAAKPSSPQRGLVTSDDDGETWSKLDFTARDWIEVLDSKDNFVFAKKVVQATKDETFYYSNDYGYSWNTFQAGSATFLFDISFDSSGTIYAGTDAGLFKSTDDGDSWIAVSLTVVEIVTEIETKSGYVFVVGMNVAEQIKLLFSTDGFQSFQMLNSPNEVIPEMGINQNGDVYVIGHDAATEAKPEVTTHIYKSTDNGNNWTTVKTNPQNQDGNVEYEALAFNSNNYVFAGGLKGLVLSTNNGTSWSDVDLMQQYASVVDLATTPEDILYVALNVEVSVLRSTNNGTKWDTVNTGILDNRLKSMITTNEGYIYYSNNFLFSTVDEESMLKVQLSEPPNLITNIGRHPTFKWNETDRALHYEFQISSIHNFSGVFERVILSDTEWELKDSLQYAKKYYWRVRTKTNDSFGPWSYVWTLESKIPPPELVYPVNELGGYDTSLTFTWHPVEEADVYDFELSIDENFDSLVVSAEDIADTSYYVEGLEYFKKYYWRVRAKNQQSTSNWSSVWYFKTIFDEPILREPPDSSINLPTEVTMRWDTTTGAESYEVRIATDSSFNDIVYEGATDDSTIHTISLLEYYTTYYWQIRGILGDIEGYWTPAWRYTTIMKPAALNSPADSTYNMPFEVKFEWAEYEEAEHYHLQIATDPQFGNVIFEDEELTGFEHVQSDLEGCHTYYWRLRYLKGDHIGEWSEVRMFTTDMTPPELTYPEDKAANVMVTTNVVWNEVSCADFYELHLATDEEFTENLMKFDSIDHDRKSLRDLLDSNTTYYWRLRGKNEHGIGPWSDTLTFTTQGPSSVEFLLELEDSYYISPNPAHKFIYINFNIPEPAKIEIQLVDIAGNKVGTLYNGYKDKGSHRIRWDNNDNVSGVYIFRLIIDRTVLSRKAVILE